jgi:hypothetical protein
MEYFTNFIKRDIGNAMGSGEELKIVLKDCEIIDAQIRNVNGDLLDVKTYILKDRVYFRLRMGWLNMTDIPSGDYTYNVWYWDKKNKKSGVLVEEFYVFMNLR